MKRLPSLLRIIKVDYGASIGLIAPAVMWAMALAARLFDAEAAEFFLQIAPVVTVAGLLLFSWRAWTIRQIFSEGIEAPGVIAGLGFFRGRGRVEYVYTCNSRKYRSSNAVQASAITRSLAHGQSVTVMAHRLNPKRAFVRELYL